MPGDALDSSRAICFRSECRLHQSLPQIPTYISPSRLRRKAMANDHQTYKKPPTTIKDIYKTFHKLNTNSLDQRPDLIDLNREEDFKRHDLKQLDTVLLPTELRNILLDFLGSAQDGHVEIPVPRPPQAFEVKSIPGKPLSSQISTLSSE